MAAGEDEAQSVIAEYGLVLLVDEHLRLGLRGGAFEIQDLALKYRIAAHAIHGLVAARAHQPGAWIRRYSGGRPLFDGRRKGVLPRLLGPIEIAEQADQCRQDTARLSAKYLIHELLGRHPAGGQIGRTSMLPYLAPGTRAAMEIASSRFFASTR